MLTPAGHSAGPRGHSCAPRGCTSPERGGGHPKGTSPELSKPPRAPWGRAPLLLRLGARCLAKVQGARPGSPHGYRTTPVTHPWIIESWLQCSAEKFGKTTGTTRARWAAGSSELRVSSYHTRRAVEMQTSKVFCIWRQSYIPFSSKTFF